VSTRDRVLAALLASDGLVSGEAIADELGLSRVAVRKHVDALRRDGCAIEVVRGSGYRLVALPDAAVPAGVGPRLTSDFWVAVEGAFSTVSTNDDAKSLAEKGAPEGTVVVASRQLKGRGRLGREWSSPEGGAYASVVLRPPVAVAEVSSLALAIAVGVARGLKSLGLDPGIKWPNDVLLDADKVAGILLEMSTEAEAVSWVVAGIGLNVSRPAEPFEGAAYLGDVLPHVSAASVCAAVLDAVAATYLEWVRDGFGALKAEYELLDALAGRTVAVSGARGDIRAQGTACGVDEAGRLLMATAQGVVAVSSGEVTLRRR
jgi:BirA family biotin operon repressor/biotin-[acetyl-CoA-carboxylase] ligase